MRSSSRSLVFRLHPLKGQPVSKQLRCGAGFFALVVSFLLADAARAADLKLIWPLKRTAYQDNEWIDVSVLRSSPQALAAGDLAHDTQLHGRQQARVQVPGRGGRRRGRCGVGDGKPAPQRPLPPPRALHGRGRRRWRDGQGRHRHPQPRPQERVPAHRLGPGRRRSAGVAGRGQPRLQHVLRQPGRRRRRQPRPRRRGFHARLHHGRRPPDGDADGVRLVRSLRDPRGHDARRPCRSRIAPGPTCRAFTSTTSPA